MESKVSCLADIDMFDCNIDLEKNECNLDKHESSNVNAADIFYYVQDYTSSAVGFSELVLKDIERYELLLIKSNFDHMIVYLLLK